MGADGRRRDIGPGDYVARGTVLAQIRHQDLKNQLDQATATLSPAQAQHVEATKDYERAKTLYASESLTKPDFDRAQAKFDSTLAAVDQAKASLHQAQLALQDADLTAPFSGYIISRNIELGNLAAPGTSAFTHRRHKCGQDRFWRSRLCRKASTPGATIQHSSAERSERVQRAGHEYCRERR